MKVSGKRAALIVEVNGKLHQAILTNEQATQICLFAAAIQGGKLELKEEPIESISLVPEV